MMEAAVDALRSEFNRNQGSCALKSRTRAQTITWNGSESRWPAAADSWKSLRCPLRWTEAGQVWRGLACQGCFLPLLTIRGAGGCRGGCVQIGSLRGGLYVWSETKIITALLVTMSLALPLSLAWCFLPVAHRAFSLVLTFSLCFCQIIVLTKCAPFLPKFPADSHLYTIWRRSWSLQMCFVFLTFLLLKDMSVGHVFAVMY